MSLANFGEPVTLVRSPMFTKFVSGRMRERLEPAQAGEGLDLGRNARRQAAHASAIFLMCGGVVPQQPPTMFSQPFGAHSRKLRRERFRRFRKTRRQQRIGQAGVGIATHVNRRDLRQFLDQRPHFLRTERAIHAHAQSSGTCEMEFQKASTVCPVTPRLLPFWMNVTEAMSGTVGRLPARARCRRAGELCRVHQTV
jgi:hypothetical protein